MFLNYIFQAVLCAFLGDCLALSGVFDYIFTYIFTNTFILIYHPAKFDGHRCCGRAVTRFFSCVVTACQEKGTTLQNLEIIVAAESFSFAK